MLISSIAALIVCFFGSRVGNFSLLVRFIANFGNLKSSDLILGI